MTILKHEEQRINKVIFFCDQQMRTNYYRFGDAVSLDFKLHQMRSQEGKGRQYLAGVFTGQDTSLRHTLFGVALICGDSEDNYVKALKYFLKGMKTKRVPRCFIVNSSEKLISAVEKVSTYYHEQGLPKIGCMVSWYHLIEKMLKTFRNVPKKEELVNKFSNLLSSLN